MLFYAFVSYPLSMPESKAVRIECWRPLAMAETR
jgi:hypothetical protein